MNPFMLGMQALSGFNNPEAFANAMASAGITPQGLAPNMLAPQSLQNDPLGGFFTPSMNEGDAATMAAVGTPTSAATPAAGTIDPMKLLQGVKTPEAVKPVFNAGVSGAQKAPEATASGLQGGAQTQAAILQALLGNRADPLRVPALGSLLAGI